MSIALGTKGSFWSRRTARLLAIFLGCTLAGCASTDSVSLWLENDSFTPGKITDANYTHGTAIVATRKKPVCDVHETGRSGCEPNLLDKALNAVNVFGPSPSASKSDPTVPAPTKFSYGLGQQIWTPDDISRPEIIQDDRPYFGWLFLNGRLDNYFQPNPLVHGADFRLGDRRRSIDLKIGTTGRSSKAGHTQRWWHRECDCTTPSGWHNQVRDEPAFILSFEQADRIFDHAFSTREHGWRADVVSNLGASLGNVYTGAEAGVTARFGRNLPRDFQPITIGPTVKTNELDRDEKARGRFRAYIFTSLIARGVARDMALEGGIFNDSPHTVDRKPWVGEAHLGFAVEFSRFAVQYLLAHRTKQFVGQRKDHRFAQIQLKYSFDQ